MSKGNQLNVWVSITGHPCPKIAWTVHGKEIHEDNDISLMSDGDKHLMSIRKAARKHHGVYKITAVNEVGEDAKDISITMASISCSTNCNRPTGT